MPPSIPVQRNPSIEFYFFFFSPQLTVGLYEFEVIVEGDGAHGEGYVNVTVKPGDCFYYLFGCQMQLGDREKKH